MCGGNTGTADVANKSNGHIYMFYGKYINLYFSLFIKSSQIY